jgi:acetyl-CoA hydrolase
MATSKTYPSLTADEAAALIPNGAMVAVSGFTPAGAPKVVPRALANEPGNFIRQARRFR